jgi:hypothetical protein
MWGRNCLSPVRRRFSRCGGLILLGWAGGLLSLSENALSAFEERPSGARQAGVGGTAQAIPGEFWSAIRNPSLLPSLPPLTFCVSLIPSPFGLVELTRGCAGAGVQTPVGSAAVYCSSFGFSLYRELEGGMAFGHDLAPRVSAGVAVRIYSLSIAGYGAAVSAGAAVGFRALLADRVEASLLVDNLFRSRIGSSGESAPTVLSASVVVGPLAELTGYLSVARDSRYPAESAFGIEWMPASIIRLRCGLSMEPESFAGGFSVTAGGVAFEYGARWHPELGPVHALSLCISP